MLFISNITFSFHFDHVMVCTEDLYVNEKNTRVLLSVFFILRYLYELLYFKTLESDVTTFVNT